MFIHWGIYSMGARHEWLKTREEMSDAAYAPYFDYFDPDLYDPDAWAEAASDAGMKYFVITTKHHDGFNMFHTKLTPYSVVEATPYKRDVVKELAEACRTHIADYKVPKKILFMDEIPKGATGKLQRIGLAQKLGLG